MKPKLRLRRRPSASMAISVLALFVALGGVGWAATQLPPGSVGTAQIQDAAVTNHKILDGSVGNFKLKFGAVGPRKIAPGAVGANQINSTQVQARVTGTCAGTATVDSIESSGAVHCVSASLPAEFGASSSTVTLGVGPTPVLSKSLPAGSSYLIFAQPHALMTSSVAGQQVEVDCTLSVSPSNGASVTRTWITEIGPSKRTQEQAVPLVVPAPAAFTAETASVSCIKLYSAGAAPKVTAASTINAIQIASIG